MTAKYLLDTDAFSDIMRGIPNVEARFWRASPSLVRVSAVTVKEIQYGRSLHPERVIHAISSECLKSRHTVLGPTTTPSPVRANSVAYK